MNTPPPVSGLALRAAGLVLLACCGAVAAEPEPAAEPVAEPALAPLEWSAPRSAPMWSARAAEDLRPASVAATGRFSIVELPAPTMPGTRAPRPQHALSIRSQAPQRMLRSMGIEATDCATRLRMPSKLKQSGGGVNFSVQAQIGLACRF